MQKRLCHDISQCDLNFLSLNSKNLLRLYFNINKFHIKYITDMMHQIKKKYNSKCMSKYKNAKTNNIFQCFRANVRCQNLSYLEEFITRVTLRLKTL